jgi:hypothetical protein
MLELDQNRRDNTIGWIISMLVYVKERNDSQKASAAGIMEGGRL